MHYALNAIETRNAVLDDFRNPLQLDSAPKRGTVFRFFLPAVSGSPASEIEPAREELHATGGVLVVDDERGIRRMASRMLRGLGFEVHEAASGEEALALMDELGDLQLVLCDLSMPGMDGQQTMRALREHRPGLPVLFSSGYDASDSRATGRGEGGVGFLQKPYRVEDLEKALEELLGSPPDADEK